MKKYLIAMLALATVSLTGCTATGTIECGMSEEQMKMMEEMKAHIDKMQSQVESNAADTNRVKEMMEKVMMQ